MSSLAWIDYDEVEHQRARRIMAMFEERENRDELGLGAIRDSISDHLFPGTNTLQTRLRYMLFIPWLFQILDSRNVPPDRLREEGRKIEVGFIDSLKNGGEGDGVIGRVAGASLQQLPSSVYWTGLGEWGIRTFPGSVESLLMDFRSQAQSRSTVGDDDESGGTTAIWIESLPPRPDDLLERAVFQLNRDEAQFIVDRLVATHPAALFTWLARNGSDGECDDIWEHPHLANFPENARRVVQHGEIFSQVMQGAALLYNLALSELRGKNDWVERYQVRLRSWSNDLDIAKVRDWRLQDFWSAIAHRRHDIRPAARRFVAEWRDLVADAGSDIASPEARRLVEERERKLKAGQSRYTNQAVRDRWSGKSGVDRLNFRWGQAKSHLRDIAHAK